jgi:hypothetical protein
MCRQRQMCHFPFRFNTSNEVAPVWYCRSHILVGGYIGALCWLSLEGSSPRGPKAVLGWSPGFVFMFGWLLPNESHNVLPKDRRTCLSNVFHVVGGCVMAQLSAVQASAQDSGAVFVVGEITRRLHLRPRCQSGGRLLLGNEV